MAILPYQPKDKISKAYDIPAFKTITHYLVPERKPLFLSFRLKGEIFELAYFQWHKISRSARNDNFG